MIMMSKTERYWKKKLTSQSVGYSSSKHKILMFIELLLRSFLLFCLFVCLCFFCALEVVTFIDSHFHSLSLTLNMVTELDFLRAEPEVRFEWDVLTEGNQKIPSSVDTDDSIWTKEAKNDFGGSEKARERKAQLRLLSTLSSVSGHLLGSSLGGMASAAVARSAFGDTCDFTVYNSMARRISGEIAWQPLCLGKMNRHTFKPLLQTATVLSGSLLET